MKTALLFFALLCVALGCFVGYVAGAPTEPAAQVVENGLDPETAEEATSDTETKVFDEIAGFSRTHRGRFYFNREEGGIISVWSEQEGGSVIEPRWRLEQDCQPECPHTYLWADFDGDGGKDLFVLAGDENEGVTSVYLQRWTRGENGEPHLDFHPALHDDEDLGSVIYLDGERRPVILMRAGDLVSEDEETAAADVCATDLAARAIQPEVDRKYTELSREFAKLNYDYGATPTEMTLEDWEELQIARDAAFEGGSGPSLYNLKIFEPVRILAARGDRFMDATPQFGSFFKWRERVLKSASKVASEECKRYIDELLLSN